MSSTSLNPGLPARDIPYIGHNAKCLFNVLTNSLSTALTVPTVLVKSVLKIGSFCIQKIKEIFKGVLDWFFPCNEYDLNALKKSNGDENVDDAFESALYNVQRGGKALACVSFELRNDRDVVLAAVRKTGASLKHASLELRDDRDVVLAAVRKNGLALEHASSRLRDDRDIVLAAVRKNELALEHASSRLRSEIELSQWI